MTRVRNDRIGIRCGVFAERAAVKLTSRGSMPMYAPTILLTTQYQSYDFAQHIGVLHTDIIAREKIRYRYIFELRLKETKSALLYVTSEQNAMYGVFGSDLTSDGSHFLCMFRGGLHYNFGDSNDWADIDKFEARAIAIIAEQLNYPVNSVRRLGKVDPHSLIANLMRFFDEKEDGPNEETARETL
jgi:hypothetical protein